MATMLMRPSVMPTPREIILKGLDSSDVWGPEMEMVVRIANNLASEYLAVMQLTPNVNEEFAGVPFEESDTTAIVTDVYDWTPMSYPVEED